MATITSTGIGTSGLDVEGIITKLVALEQRPLNTLKQKNELITARITAYSQIKSMAATLEANAALLANPATWKSMSVSSSDSLSVSVMTSGTTSPVASTLSITVSQLARAQSAASGVIGATASVGSGKLTIDLGEWSGGAFTAGAAAAISVDVLDGENLAAVAAKINAAGAGVTATVLTDANGQRLLMRSSATGELAGFRITASANDPADDVAGLSRLTFDPAGSPGLGLAANTASVQYGANAIATVNGIEVESTSNTFTDTVPGLIFTVAKLTTGSVDLTTTPDTTAMKRAIQSLVESYNTINSYLTATTKYDATTEQAALLQADPTAVGMQTALRGLLGSATEGGALGYLSDVGVSLQKDGSLAVNSAKMNTAFANPDAVKTLFTSATGDSQTEGLALKLKKFASGLIASDGSITTRSDSLTLEQKRNEKDQIRVTDRVSLVEKRLRAQYTALDTKMAQLTALDTYITQQVAQWNKAKD